MYGPCRGLVKIVCAPSHPGQIGVGYVMPSLQDFKKSEMGKQKREI